MNLTDWQQKKERFERVMNQSLPYEGQSNLQEINAYLDSIHHVLAEVIFDGCEKKPSIALKNIKQFVAKHFDQHNADMMEVLRNNVIYGLMAMRLMEERWEKDVAQNAYYRNSEMGVHTKVEFSATAQAPLSVARSEGGTLIAVSPLGVVFYDKAQKRGGLAHESAHLALGHLDDDVVLPNDRRQIEHDADHVAALSKGAVNLIAIHKANSVIKKMFPMPALKEENIRSLIDQEVCSAYKVINKNPGENEEFDAYMELARKTMFNNYMTAASWVYPKAAERIEELSALQMQLQYQNKLLKLSPHYEEHKKELHRQRVSEAIAARHINRGAERG